MSVYLFEHYMTADEPAEAAAMAARLALPADRLRMADTPRWHWLLEHGDREWAVTYGALEVGVDVFRQLVLRRRMDEAVAAANSGGPMPPGVIACGPPPRRPPKWNPDLCRHRWVRDPVEHQRHCDWCGIVTLNNPGKHGRWFKLWRWPRPASVPAGTPEWDGTTVSGDKVPACPGPDATPPPPPPPVPEQGTLC